MRSLEIFILLSSLTVAAPTRAADSLCRISLEIVNKPVWTLDIGPDSIRGDRNVLNREDNVVFGFINGKPARLKMTEDRMTGRLTGAMVVLQLERGQAHTKLSGMLDRGRLVAEASDEGIELRDLSMRLTLKPFVHSSPDAPYLLASSKGSLKLIFDGCDLNLVHARPELLLMLHRLVLPRARQLEDIPIHFRTGRSSNESSANRKVSPQPAPMSPRRQRSR